jgi:proton-translocating NADH-quinone oxidoreductase chain M
MFYLFFSFFIASFLLLLSRNLNRLFAFFFFALIFFGSVALSFFFQKSAIHFQFLKSITHLDFWNFSYLIGLDGLSLSLLILSTFLILFCTLNYWHLRYQMPLYLFCLALSLWFLLNVFTILDFMLFFFFFEAVVIPMYLLVGIWGSRVRKIYAAYQLFIYTLFGSFFMMICFFDIYLQQGSGSFLFFDSSMLYHEERQYFLWLFLFLGFAVKLPTFPVHIWLPEAHVEAPTPGSILLAGVILKLGSYGLLRFFFGGSFTAVSFELIYWIYALALIGFLYGSLVALNQQDLKKTIAYSSIAHMNFSLLGLFSGHVIGVLGALFLALGHGIGAAGLFFGIGLLYDRYKSRLVHYYGGLANLMPLFSAVYLILILANFGFPGTFNFVGELFLLSGFFYQSLFTAVIANIGLVLTLIYSLFLYNRVFFGPFKPGRIAYFCDLSRLEFYLATLLCFLILWGGLAPNFILSFFHLFLCAGAL